MRAPLEYRLLSPELAGVVQRFFRRLVETGGDRFFHPHPFTGAEAARRVQYNGKDLYYALLVDGEMVGYGILRGWDEGYEVPSLGIAVDPASQGRGYGRLLIEFLHGTARQRGAKRIRLKVYAHNLRALALYKSLGYVFQGEEGDQRVAYLDL